MGELAVEFGDQKGLHLIQQIVNIQWEIHETRKKNVWCRCSGFQRFGANPKLCGQKEMMFRKGCGGNIGGSHGDSVGYLGYIVHGNET